MAKINFIFFCNNTEVSPETHNLNIIGIFDTILAEKFPATHRLMFVVVNFDISGGHHVEFFKITKDGKPVLTSPEFPFEAMGEKHQFVHKIGNLVLHEPGKYIVEIFVDGQLIGSNLFIVRAKENVNYA